MPEYAQTVSVAITGASGIQYGLRLTQCLINEGLRVYLMVSKAAHVVTITETDYKLPAQAAKMSQYLSEKLPQIHRLFLLNNMNIISLIKNPMDF